MPREEERLGSLAAGVRLQQHPPEQGHGRLSPGYDIPQGLPCSAQRQCPNLCSSQDSAPQVHLAHPPHKPVGERPQQGVPVFAKHQCSPRLAHVPLLDNLSFARCPVEPQVGCSLLGGPGDAEVQPGLSLELQGEAEEVTSKPQPQLCPHGHHQLVVTVPSGVGQDGLAASGVGSAPETQGEGLERHSTEGMNLHKALDVFRGEVESWKGAGFRT